MSDSQETGMATVSIRARVASCEVTVTLQLKDEELKSRLASVLEKLTEIGLEPLPGSEESRDDRFEEEQADVRKDREDPYGRLSRELEIAIEDVKRVLGFKGESVQLYRAGQLSPSEAVSALCLAHEKGLGAHGVAYDTLSAVIAANHIKMKTPLSTFCFNLMRDGTIDKKSYDDGRLIVLTPSGEQKAAKAIKELLSGGSGGQTKVARPSTVSAGRREGRQRKK